MSSGRYSRPIEPSLRQMQWHGQDKGTVPGRAESKGQKLDMTQNLFRMWRDFPDLRFGQFIDNALVFAGHKREIGSPGCTHTVVALSGVEDDALERACYKFWVHHSGRRVAEQLKEKWT